MSTIISLFGLLWFLPMGVVEACATDFSAITPAGRLVVVCYGVFVTVPAYFFWFAGITRLPPSTAGEFTAIMPVSALVLSVLVLGEPIGWQQLTGCGCVLGGIALMHDERPSSGRASDTLFANCSQNALRLGLSNHQTLITLAKEFHAARGF